MSSSKATTSRVARSTDTSSPTSTPKITAAAIATITHDPHSTTTPETTSPKSTPSSSHRFASHQRTTPISSSSPSSRHSAPSSSTSTSHSTNPMQTTPTGTFTFNPLPQPTTTFSAYRSSAARSPLAAPTNVATPSTTRTPSALPASTSTSTDWTNPQRASLVAAPLLSALALLLTLLTVHRLRRTRSRKVAELERGPDVTRGRRPGRNGSQRGSGGGNGRSDNDSDSDGDGGGSRQGENGRRHHHGDSCPWWAVPIRSLCRRWGGGKRTRSSPRTRKRRGIEGLEGIVPGPAVMRSLFESGGGVDGSRAAGGVVKDGNGNGNGDGDGDGRVSGEEGAIKAEVYEMRGVITRGIVGGE